MWVSPDQSKERAITEGVQVAHAEVEGGVERAGWKQGEEGEERGLGQWEPVEQVERTDKGEGWEWQGQQEE